MRERHAVAAVYAACCLLPLAYDIAMLRDTFMAPAPFRYAWRHADARATDIRQRAAPRRVFIRYY